MTIHTDILIVGAGPAGSTLACLLADRGIQSTVVDRAHFPRVKPCGETLNPGAVALLREMGFLGDVMGRGPAQIAGWRMTGASDQDAVGMYQQGQIGLGLPRRDLDSVLLQHAQIRGARIIQGTKVVGIERRSPHGFDIDCVSEGKNRQKIRSRILVGADGLRSVVSRRLGMVGRKAILRKFSITCRLEGDASNSVGMLHVLKDGTFGFAPVHESAPLWNGTLVMPSGVWHGTEKNALNVYKKYLPRMTREWTTQPEIVDGPWTSGPFDRPVTSVCARDVLLIGDAAGYYDPLTGQGVFQALRTAQLAADAIERVCAVGERQSGVFASYTRNVRHEHRWTRMFQRAVEYVLANDNVRGVALKQLGKRGDYMDRLVRFAGDSLSVSGLTRLDLLVRPSWLS